MTTTLPANPEAIFTYGAPRLKFGPGASDEIGLPARGESGPPRVGGCCGLAGDFGVERGHYEVSAAVAETALLPAVRAAGPAAVVLADGFSCRTQLADLAGQRGVHLAQLLASRLPADGAR